MRDKIPGYGFPLPLNSISFLISSYVYIGSFADGQLTDALKHLATDHTTDPKVRKKVLAVLASWSKQFKDDRGTAGIAGLYRQVKPSVSEANREALTASERERESEKRRKEKDEAKQQAKEKRREEARSKKAASRTATSRKQFNFEQVCNFSPLVNVSALSSDSHPNSQEKPQVLTAIANASSAANNLVNAIMVCPLQSRGWMACLYLTEARQHRER